MLQHLELWQLLFIDVIYKLGFRVTYSLFKMVENVFLLHLFSAKRFVWQVVVAAITSLVIQ